jgi:hypothetical protein
LAVKMSARPAEYSVVSPMLSTSANFPVTWEKPASSTTTSSRTSARMLPGAWIQATFWACRAGVRKTSRQASQTPLRGACVVFISGG